jgi:DNA-binding MarR family transcriptional regulator
MKRTQVPTRPPNPLTLERFLPYRLSVLANRVSGGLARIYAQRFDMTVPEWRVFAVLGRFAGLTAGEIADRAAMDKVTVSRAVARLEKAGRLVRQVDPGDRRRHALAFTPEGARIYSEIVPLAQAYEAELQRGLSADDLARLDDLLDRLTRQVPASATR